METLQECEWKNTMVTKYIPGMQQFKKKLKRKNYFYCSEFVRTVLLNAGVVEKDQLPNIIKPIDFLSLKNAEKIYEGNLKEYVESFN